ncbi:hypothetical protein [Streptomyces wuyuanensis]
MAERGLSGNVSSITQQANSEWYDAMRQFCSSLREHDGLGQEP